MSLPGAQDHLVVIGLMSASPLNLMSPLFALNRSIAIRRLAFVLLGLLLLAACQPADKVYMISDGGFPRAVEGRFETVGEVVAGIELGPKDTVSPPLDAPADPDGLIVIDRASEVRVLGVAGEQRYLTQAETLGAFLAEAGIEPKPGERLLADGRVISRAAVAAEPLPAVVVLDPFVTVTVEDGDESQTVRLPGGSVADALREAEVALGPFDSVSPAPDAPLEAGLVVVVTRAAPFIVVADGEQREVSADSALVADILATSEVILGPLDTTRPALDATVEPGGIIEVVRVTETVEAQEEPIPYETLYQPDPARNLDTVALVSGGSPGVLRRETRVRYENGVETGRETSEFVAAPPVNEVIAYGTNIVIRTLDTPDGPIEYWRVVNMKAVAYTPRSAGKNPGDPGYGITASGLPAGKGVVAVDPSVVPFRSQVYVPGYGIAIAGDTGGGVKGRLIDLGYDDDESYVPWRGTVDVYYLTPIPPADTIRYILP